MNIVPLKTSEVIPYDQNPRHNDVAVDKVAASIAEFGFKGAILLDKNKVIICGHTRLKAAMKLGLETVPCQIADDLTDEQVKAFRLVDNKVGELADWDEELLALELGGIEDIDMAVFGFEMPEPEDAPDPDAVPEPPKIAITQPGDVWILGRHRLLCGDSTKREDVEKLMDGKKADMVFTDPPYGVDYSSACDRDNTKHRKIENDKLTKDQTKDFFLSCFTNLERSIKEGCPFYVCAPQGGDQMMMMMMSMSDANIPIRHELIWLKNQMVFGRSDYHYKHEPILYGWKKGAAHYWNGGRDKTSILEFDKPHVSDLHPTMKPVELIEYLIGNSSKPDDIVLDLFGGSGSTMIAAEKTKRVCYMMELDQLYCDVICRRWQDFTGSRAVNLRTGTELMEMEAKE